MVLEIWNTIFIFDLSRTNFWQINLRVWSFQNLLSMFGFWRIFSYNLIHMFELCGNFFSTNKFLCFNFVEFVFEKSISTFWTFWTCFGQIICFGKINLKIEHGGCFWQIDSYVLTLWNVIWKINFYIWTFLQFFSNLFFHFVFCFNLWNCFLTN